MMSASSWLRCWDTLNTLPEVKIKQVAEYFAIRVYFPCSVLFFMTDGQNDFNVYYILDIHKTLSTLNEIPFNFNMRTSSLKSM